MAVFESSLSRTLNECLAIGTQRGGEYADSWAPENVVSVFSKCVEEHAPGDMRLRQLAALCDVKLSRIGSGGPLKRDSFVDMLNYAGVLCDLLTNAQPTTAAPDFYESVR